MLGIYAVDSTSIADGAMLIVEEELKVFGTSKAPDLAMSDLNTCPKAQLHSPIRPLLLRSSPVEAASSPGLGLNRIFADLESIPTDA